MKIVFVCHDANLTGAPKLGFEIARFFARDADLVMVVKKDGPLTEFPAYRSVFRKIINVNNSHEIVPHNETGNVRTATRVLEEERPDLLYVNSVASSEWCKAGKKCNIPVVLHSHEMRSELLSLESVKIFKRDLPAWVDLLITVSPDAESDIIRECTIPFKDIFSSAPGIDFDRVRVLSKSEDAPIPKNIFGEPLRGDRPLISMCGIASQRKGSDIFLETAGLLQDLDFLWIGAWDKEESPGNTAFAEYTAHPLANLYTTGNTRNPYPYFKRTELFVLTSREDPNPLVVMEALFLSKGCLGFSDTGGSKYLLNRFGILLQGRPSSGRLAFIIPKIDLSSPSGFLTAGKKQVFMKENNIESIAAGIRSKVLALASVN